MAAQAPNPWEDESSPQASSTLGLLALPQTPDNMCLRGLTQGPRPQPRFMAGESFKPHPSSSGHLCSCIRAGHPEKSQDQRSRPYWPRATGPSVTHSPAPPVSTPEHTGESWSHLPTGKCMRTHSQAHTAATFPNLQTQTRSQSTQTPRPAP